MTKIKERKTGHVSIALKQKMCSRYRYWDDIILVHEALPEINYDDIDTTSRLLGKILDFPFIVTAITGGFKGAKKINENIAIACSELGIGMGIGSERAALEGIYRESYSVIKEYDIPLVVGNIGAPQLVKQKSGKIYTNDDISLAMELVDADYMAIHLNFLQESIQLEGDVNGMGCYDAIKSLAHDFPLIVKETGAGMSSKTISKLDNTGVKAIDISGMGGTNFSAIEMRRAADKKNVMKQKLGYTYLNWGIPTPVSLINASKKVPVISSGGVINGLDIAKSIVLGAICAGGSSVILRESTRSAGAVMDVLKCVKEEFKTAMMLTGCRSVDELMDINYLVTGKTREWLEGFKCQTQKEF
ncbi:MAG: type 2 isopentenyl-diphosphate Delta-isomerase [archaeon]|nr:type 2 isopentenyl-diphosphate Delta-isomerase [archaeon]